MTKVSSYHACN